LIYSAGHQKIDDMNPILFCIPTVIHGGNICAQYFRKIRHFLPPSASGITRFADVKTNESIMKRSHAIGVVMRSRREAAVWDPLPEIPDHPPTYPPSSHPFHLITLDIVNDTTRNTENSVSTCF